MKTDDELRAEWTGTITIVRDAEPVYKPAEHTVPASTPFQYDSYGRRIFTNLDKRGSAVIDESTFNYGD